LIWGFEKVAAPFRKRTALFYGTFAKNIVLLLLAFARKWDAMPVAFAVE